MNAVWIEASDLKVKELEAKSKQSFYNYVLGMPYEDVKMSVTDDDVYGNVHNYTQFLENREEYRFVGLGIDWGNLHSISVLGMRTNGQIDLIGLNQIRKSGATDSFNIGTDLEQVKMYIAQVKPDIIIADIGDSGDRVAKLIKTYGEGKVFGCKYNSSPKSTGQLAPTWSDNTHTVTVDKLMQNKRVISMIKEGRIHHPNNSKLPELQTYTYHWKNVFIRDEEDQRTGEFYQIIGRKSDDHLAQATIYAFLGLERLVDAHYGSDKYGFTADFVSTQYEPEKPDIQNIYG